MSYRNRLSPGDLQMIWIALPAFKSELAGNSKDCSLNMPEGRQDKYGPFMDL